MSANSKNTGRPAGKRRIRKGRAALLVILCIVVVAAAGTGIGFAWRAWQNHQIQKQRKEEIAALIETKKQTSQRNAELQVPAGYEAQTIDTLKAAASACLGVEPLEQIRDQKSISEEEYQNAVLAPEDPACSQAQYFLDHLSEYSEEMLEYYLKNTERFDFVKAYPQRDSLQTPPQSLSESLEEVPFLLQWDTRWGYEPYGDSTVFYAGCAPTCLSMVFSYLKQDPSITPAVLKSYSEQNGFYVNGVGTAHALLSDAADQYGIAWQGIPVDQQSVSQALSEGKVLIFNMVPGTFTQVGHFIVVYQEQDGKLIVRDPNSIARTQKAWTYEEVLPETAAIWAYSAS